LCCSAIRNSTEYISREVVANHFNRQFVFKGAITYLSACRSQGFLSCPLGQARNKLQWCREGDSNGGTILNARKLLIFLVASNAATPLHLPPTAHGSGPGGAEVQNPFSPTTFILALSIFVKVPPKKVPKKES
jgi:hypothetical protein